MNWSKRILEWTRGNDLKGYDPYDFMSLNKFTRSLMYPFKQLNLPQKIIFLSIYNLDLIVPKLIRFIFNISEKKHPTYIGMLLNAESLLPKDKYDSERIDYLKNELEKLRIKNYEFHCWGTPFEWRSGDTFYKSGTPFAVVNAWVGEAYLALYNRNNSQKDLDVCISICNFFITNLIVEEYEKGISFSYSDVKASNINNSNLMVSSFLIRIGKIIKNDEFVQKGMSAAMHSISTQLESGLIPYIGDNECKHNDSYHSSYELKSLIEIYSVTRDETIKKTYDSYLNYYLNNYFHADGAIGKYPNKRLPVDGTAIADAFILYEKSINFIDENTRLKFRSKIESLEKVFIKDWLKKDGSVKYKQTKWFGFVGITYKRWIMGWFAIAAAYKLKK